MPIPPIVTQQLQGLAVGQATIEGELKVLINKHDNLQEEVDTKHHTNVVAIDEIKVGLKEVVRSVGEIQTKLAIWSAIGGLVSGAITAMGIELFKHFILGVGK